MTRRRLSDGPSECIACAAPIEQPERGRTRLYCRPACGLAYWRASQPTTDGLAFYARQEIRIARTRAAARKARASPGAWGRLEFGARAW